MLKVVKEVTAEEKMRQEMMLARPSLDEIVNLHDFEVSSWPFRKIPRDLTTFFQRQSQRPSFPLKHGPIILQHLMTRSPSARIAPRIKGSTSVIQNRYLSYVSKRPYLGYGSVLVFFVMSRLSIGQQQFSVGDPRFRFTLYVLGIFMTYN